MNVALKSIALAMIVATAPLAGAAYAQAPKTTAAPVAQPTATAPKAPIASKAPEDWILYEDTTYTPVLDDVSRHLAAARKAFEAKDNSKAAGELRAVADELKRQAALAGKQDQSLIEADRALLAADMKSGQDTVKRLNASAQKVSSAAAAVDSGKIKTTADLDKAIDKAARADMEHRWLITDVTTWYPVSEEPQHHFTDAIAAFARKDYKAVAGDIRKATSYLRLEAGRASGEARQALENSVSQLDTLAASAEKGAIKDEQSMARVFAKADHALALAHRSKAAESWAHKAYDKAGYELKAAAHGLESAASWTAGKAKANASATVAATRALGDKLASGANWTRDEVAKGFEALGDSINALGQEIGTTQKAAAVNPGA